MLNEKVLADDDVYYGLVRHSLLSFVETPPRRVLEIGCGNGATLELVKRKFSPEYVCGMEINAEVATEARARFGIDEVKVGDVEQELKSIPDDSFDLVIASHVLEHFVDPWFVSKEIHRILRSDGLLIGAMPNVRHLSVLVPLILRGQWDYQSSGILDWTHFRFFTRDGIVCMLSDAMFSTIKITPDFGGAKSRMIHYASFGLLDNFAAYAYSFSGKKKSCI